MRNLIACIGFGLALLTTPVLATAQESAQDVLARYNFEPTAEQTIQAAIDYAGISGDRLQGLYRQAAAAAALPDKVSYEMTYRDRNTDKPQDTLTLDADGTQKTDVLKDYYESQTYVQHKIKAEWKLTDLVFNKEQLDVYKEMGSSADKRDKLLKSVIKAYYARRKLQVQMDTDAQGDVMARLQQELQLQELTAVLDGYTGGWFSKQIKKR